MANETPANGSLLKVSISASFTTIANQVQFSGPAGKKAAIDKTHLASTSKGFLAGIRDWGEVTVTGNLAHAEASQAYLLTSFKTEPGPNESWKAVLADSGAAEVTFSGPIIGLEFGQAGIDGLIPFTATIKVDGDVSVAP